MMTAETNEKVNETHNIPHHGRFRRFLAQFLATTVKNILLFDLGLYLAFNGIVIPALTGILNEHNRNEKLTLTATQASWLGSIGYIIEPIGCLLSAIITDSLGRKWSMIIVNVPLAVAWFMMYNANQVLYIFIANILHGISCGFLEAPVIAYVGEICEPKFRSFLIAYTCIGTTVGILFVTTLNTLMAWRTVGLICVSVPILNIILLCFIPETPLWLLSKNRTDSAEKALCRLRGWVSREVVAEELQELQRYSERTKSCSACLKKNQKCPHPLPNWVARLHELKRKQTLKPFFIVISLIFILQFTRVLTSRPFIVQIFKAYESPIAPDQAAAVLSFVINLANIISLFLLQFTGKRRLYLTMLTVIFLCSVVICGYGFAFLPRGYNSFDQSPDFSLDNKSLAYIPFVCIIIFSFCSFCGVSSMPSQMLSELFSFKARGTATGLISALSNILGFALNKAYYNLDVGLSLPGVALFSCITIGSGIVLMYKILPETTNRSLEDIELHFSDKTKKITDRKIPATKNVKKSNTTTNIDETELPKTFLANETKNSEPQNERNCG